MIRSLALSALLAAPAAAQSVTATAEAITLHNQPEAPTDALHTFSMEIGEVTVRHTTTPNGPDGCCADRLEVMDLPEGYMAVPFAIDVEEGETGSIIIREYQGM